MTERTEGEAMHLSEHIAGVLAEVLGVHRWKSMGVSSVQCECGEICYGNESLTQFPADEAFRAHVATEQVKALGEWTREDEQVEVVTAAARGSGCRAFIQRDARAVLAAIFEATP